MGRGGDIAVEVGDGDLGDGGDILLRAGATTAKAQAGGLVEIRGGQGTSAHPSNGGDGGPVNLIGGEARGG